MDLHVRSVTLVMLAVTACKMGPNYTRPETTTGESWRIAPATSESIANLPWWELLKDPALHQLIRTALDENLDLRVAVERDLLKRGGKPPASSGNSISGAASGGRFGSKGNG